MERLTHYGSIAGSVMAIFALVGLLGKPHAIDFIDNEIESYDKRKKEEDLKKIPFRVLLSEKMGLDDDEVHIELGRMYKNEIKLHKTIDSLENEIGKLKTEDRALLNDISANYSDIIELQNKMKKAEEKHGLFH